MTEYHFKNVLEHTKKVIIKCFTQDEVLIYLLINKLVQDCSCLYSTYFPLKNHSYTAVSHFLTFILVEKWTHWLKRNKHRKGQIWQ